MKIPRPGLVLPSWQNALLAAGSAILLILSFSDFEIWILAWVAFVPLLLAIDREKESKARSFVLGWLFGIVFFFGTCWWLTFAPITYAGFPPILAYSLFFCVTVIVGLFPAIFASMFSLMLRRFGSGAVFAAPFIWVFTEFLRYWLTGNNWNAAGYSQAFSIYTLSPARYGSVYLVGFLILLANALLSTWAIKTPGKYILSGIAVIALAFLLSGSLPNNRQISTRGAEHQVIAIQPNVPMAGLDYRKWHQLRQRQIDLAEAKIREISSAGGTPTTVILPESPMNFMFAEDQEFRDFINAFARRNNVSVLFNSAEPDPSNGRYFNSAMMVLPDGTEAIQYDKIYLLPFGEAVPPLLDGLVPGFVGNFSYGGEYDLFPIGDARAGVMICFESHFGQLSREYVRNGADVLIEMTNDGYLGPTPVLRQHLANAVFRAVETRRPVLRVTNVGVTAYINESGEVLDAADSYIEDVRVWTVARSDGEQTLYVRYGDWFAWLCSAMTLLLLLAAFVRRRHQNA